MIAAIILAAGQSRRMGTQKLLLPIAGQPMIARIADQVMRSAVHQTIVVTSGDARIAAALAGRDLLIVTNLDLNGDMLSSVRCGLRALPEGYDGVLVVLGDQPGISAGMIDELIRGFTVPAAEATPTGCQLPTPSTQDSAPLPAILVPTFAGQRGHPLIFSAHYVDEILTRFDDEGLRGLLRAHAHAVVEIPLEDQAILIDIDRPEDYQRLINP